MRKIARQNIWFHIVGLSKYMENMGKIFFATISFAFAASANACEISSIDSLVVFWKDFRLASLNGNAHEASRYYSFPLLIKGPYYDDKPIRLSKKAFLKEYRAIFRVGLEGNEKSTFLKDWETKPISYWESKMTKAIMPTPGICVARIDDYVLSWKSGSGWKVKEVYYNEDYDILMNYLKNTSQ